MGGDAEMNIWEKSASIMTGRGCVLGIRSDTITATEEPGQLHGSNDDAENPIPENRNPAVQRRQPAWTRPWPPLTPRRERRLTG